METEVGSGRPSRARKTQQPTALGVRLGIFLCSPPFSEEIEGFKSTQMVNGQTKRGAGIQQRMPHQTNGSRGISSPLLSHTLFHRDATSTKVMFTYVPHQHLSFIRLRKCGSPCFMQLQRRLQRGHALGYFHVVPLSHNEYSEGNIPGTAINKETHLALI